MMAIVVVVLFVLAVVSIIASVILLSKEIPNPSPTAVFGVQLAMIGSGIVAIAIWLLGQLLTQ
jgi:hypothetical protein